MHTLTSNKYTLNVTLCLLLFTSFTFSTPLPTSSGPIQSTRVRNHAGITKTYGKLPMSFEINEGQADERVSFLSRGRGYNLFLTSNEAVLSLNAQKKQDVLRMKLPGANPSTRATGLEELPGKSNYLIGNDPKQWHTNVAHYARVKYEAVYPGVDLVYYGNQENLEYDFIIGPGADPSPIKQLFQGTQSVEIGAEGDLVLRTQTGELRQHKPFIYQETGNGHKRQIAGGYVKTGKHEVGFEVGEYNPELPLVIDPVLVYSSFLGGSGDDQLLGIGTDGAGNAYVAGYTTSAPFPTTPGAFQPSRPGGTDAFVTKFDASGTILLYSTYLGGSLSSDYAYAITVDNAGNAYVTGGTSSIDFPTTPGVVDPVPDSGGDVFVAKLNPSGSSLIYSTFVGNSGFDLGQAIAIDGAGQACVAGFTYSLNFPTTVGAFDTTFNGTSSAEDAFVTKLNATGSAFVYSTFVGGTGRDMGLGVTLDASGNTYLIGFTTSTNLPTTFGAYDRILGGSSDAFVTKLNSTGSGIFYSTYLGGSSGTEAGYGIAVDAANQAYVVGYTDAFNFPVTGSAFDRFFDGGVDVFVTKLNASGSGLVYSTFLGGSGFDVGFAIVVDGLGQAYVTGHTNSSTFPTTFGAFDTTYAGGGPSDAFMTKLNASGSALSYSTFLGGNNSDEGRGIVIDVAGKVYVGGTTRSVDFPTTPGAYDTSHNGGGYDGFVTQFQFP